MKTLILNGSPKKNGTVSKLLELLKPLNGESNSVDWINIYDLKIKPCVGCMTCRKNNKCRLPEDDAHIVGQKINEAENLIIGTPTYWGNMSSQLKVLFERNVPVFMGVKPNGMPKAMQKNKKAVIATACSVPFPFDRLFKESTGTIKSVKHILKYGGYNIQGTLIKSGTKKDTTLTNHLKRKAQRIRKKLY